MFTEIALAFMCQLNFQHRFFYGQVFHYSNVVVITFSRIHYHLILQYQSITYRPVYLPYITNYQSHIRYYTYAFHKSFYAISISILKRCLYTCFSVASLNSFNVFSHGKSLNRVDFQWKKFAHLISVRNSQQEFEVFSIMINRS